MIIDFENIKEQGYYAEGYSPVIKGTEGGINIPKINAKTSVYNIPEQEPTGTDLVGWTNDVVFSATSNVVVAWEAGSVYLADGTSYSVDAGNTGTMASITYIYLDFTSTTLNVTTTATDSVGAGKLLIAVASPVETGKDAEYQVFGTNGQSVFITADNIAANTVTANEIASNTITANQIAAATITASQIATNTITATQIATDTITADEIKANTITATEIASNTITSAEIAANTITASEIAAGTITTNEIASNTIAAGNISFNYAGSASKGGNANDTDLVAGNTASTVGTGGVRGYNALNSSYRYTQWLLDSEMSAGSNPSTGVLMDSGGIRGYKSGVKTFEIATNGDATFKGEIQASSVTGELGLGTSGTIVVDNGAGEKVEILYDSGLPKIKFTDDGSATGEIYGDYNKSISLAGVSTTINCIGITGDLYVSSDIVAQDDMIIGDDLFVGDTAYIIGKLKLPVGTNLYN